MTEPTSIPLDENQIIAERRPKLARLRAAGNPFPNDFVPADRAGRLTTLHADMSREQLEAAAVKVSVSGRMVLKRVQGKASFATLQDATGRVQLWMNDEGIGADTRVAGAGRAPARPFANSAARGALPPWAGFPPARGPPKPPPPLRPMPR